MTGAMAPVLEEEVPLEVPLSLPPVEEEREGSEEPVEDGSDSAAVELETPPAAAELEDTDKSAAELDDAGPSAAPADDELEPTESAVDESAVDISTVVLAADPVDELSHSMV